MEVENGEDHPDDMSQRGEEEEQSEEDEDVEQVEDHEVNEFGDPLYRVDGCQYNNWEGIDRANRLVEQAVEDAKNLEEDHLHLKGMTEAEMDALDVGDREDIVHYRNGFILQLIRSGLKAYGNNRSRFKKWLKTVCELTIRPNVTYPAFSYVVFQFIVTIEVLKEEEYTHFDVVQTTFSNCFCNLDDKEFSDNAANDVDGGLIVEDTDGIIDWWKGMVDTIDRPDFNAKLKVLVEKSIAYHANASAENELGDGGEQDARLKEMYTIILQSL